MRDIIKTFPGVTANWQGHFDEYLERSLSGGRGGDHDGRKLCSPAVPMIALSAGVPGDAGRVFVLAVLKVRVRAQVLVTTMLNYRE